ncbi:MAG: nucleotidyltransferase domain-containing protein [Candidatus Paceibacterota bacterium]
MITFNEEKIEKLAQKHDLSLVMLFGSQATGKTHSQSDVDIGFLSTLKKDLSERIKIEMDFQQELQNGRIQIVDLTRVSPLLLHYAVQDGKVLYERDSLVAPTFFAKVFKLYIETQPLRDIRAERLKKITTS